MKIVAVANQQGGVGKTATVVSLAEAQAKTEAKVDRLAGLVERLAGGQG